LMNELQQRARKLGLRAIVSNWEHYCSQDWLQPFIAAEELERDKRSLDRRIKEAQIGQFKPMSKFDWDWPEIIDRDQVEDLFSLDFLKEKANVVLVGGNGIGKTMIAQNLAHQVVTGGHTTRFVKASQMLNQLLQCRDAAARARNLKKYCSPELLVIDEVGYMNYDNRYADLLYEVISGRYQNRSTIVTTNKAYTAWGEIFPNAACVVTLVDRLVHNAESIVIDGESYRAKEAKERAATKQKERNARKKNKKPT
jgi:DNA replication protein DnaC